MPLQTFTAAISIVFITLLSVEVSAQPTSTNTNKNQTIRATDSQKIQSNVIKPTVANKTCKVCAQYDRGQPGQLFGPCLRYEYKPCPPNSDSTIK
jgi:hypothetical protein